MMKSRMGGMKSSSAPGLSFFDARKLREFYPEEFRGWFFEIYIQGSKYNFLELSLRNTTGR